MSDLAARIQELFEAERTSRRLQVELLRAAPDALVSALRAEVKAAISSNDSQELAVRAVCLSPLLADMPGPIAADLLIDMLGSEEPEARHAAGEALESAAFDRFKEVALAVERALERLPSGNPALTELPYLLAEVGEPGCTKLLGRFLTHKDADAVAAAIEAAVELGDPSLRAQLKALEKDGRQVDLEEDSDEGRVTIGELATEARELIERMAES